MPRQDFTTPRLFVSARLTSGETIALDKGQANYLRNVLRLASGAAVLVFNGRDGEWRATLSGSGKEPPALTLTDQCRPQPRVPDLVYAFALLKHARLDYMVQKAVEMGAGSLQPLITRRTQVSRVNLERMRANVIEAAEQCGVLHVPPVQEAARLDTVLAAWPPERRLIFCDEDADVADPFMALGGRSGETILPVGLVIGPEGGFDPAERTALMATPHAVRLSLGPRILRADTAAVAALALVQATLGDWR